jgi:hypothetical protein
MPLREQVSHQGRARRMGRAERNLSKDAQLPRHENRPSEMQTGSHVSERQRQRLLRARYFRGQSLFQESAA